MQVLGASFDSTEGNAAFAAKYSLNFPLLCDTEKSTAALGAGDGPKAKRAAILIGADGTVEKMWPRVQARTFPDEFLRSL